MVNMEIYQCFTFPDKYPQCWPNQNPGGESWLHGSTRPPMARTGPRPHWGSSLPSAAGTIYQPIALSITILSKIQFPFCWSLDWVKVIWPTALNSIWLFNVTPSTEPSFFNQLFCQPALMDVSCKFNFFVNTSDPGGVLFCCLSTMCVSIIENRPNAQRLPSSRRGSKELMNAPSW